MRHYDPVHTLGIADRIPELGQVPVQLIWGVEEDKWQTLDWARRLNRTIPGSQLTILEECAHFAPEDPPERIAELISRFAGAAAGR